MRQYPAAYARYRAILDAPVVYCIDVPMLAWACGHEPRWSWTPRNRYRDGGIYFASNEAGETKIGFSDRPAHRVNDLHLSARLFIAEANFAHEIVLHDLFRRDRVHGEFFRGPRVETFLAAARERSRSRGRDWHFAGYFARSVRKQEVEAA